MLCCFRLRAVWVAMWVRSGALALLAPRRPGCVCRQAPRLSAPEDHLLGTLSKVVLSTSTTGLDCTRYRYEYSKVL